MTFIKSISGFRGTIGGEVGQNLTPLDIVENTAAYGQWILASHTEPSIVIGMDGRNTGPMVASLVANTLIAMGIDVISIGLTTTPTLEMYVTKVGAAGGIILSASHNPMNWNALKILNSAGEFISKKEGELLMKFSEEKAFTFAGHEDLGSFTEADDAIDYHINEVLDHPWVRTEAIRKANFTVVVDCVNSTGALSILPLLEALNCKVVGLNTEISGRFSHDPEPLEKNLQELIGSIKAENADLGIAVDPDVDRIAFVSEEGHMFGEEYTNVAIADYLMDNSLIDKTVSNLSSSRALRDVSLKYKGEYFASAVGEVNVVEKMKAVEAAFGGEGNGGVIVPDLHYGRDALIGAALFLSGLTHFNYKVSEWKAKLPIYFMAKEKVSLNGGINADDVLDGLKERFANEETNTIDGLKIDFADEWVHMRKSNTEPIIRIYTEAKTQLAADQLAEKFVSIIQES
ncbi:phosphoglucosamine mutase [Membranihabitans marinus]|uniref:phosphoglucosamine mutase n=1 Tax=Membranihabitans marinus TaxID=1227546 RepID=UPI001F007B9B|nr:phosphoglucosamine mutase [Membranihabitans marinus]